MKREKEEIQINQKRKYRDYFKITTRISNLIKIKATFFLFVCGGKLPFTTITDPVKFHNSAIKRLIFTISELMSNKKQSKTN